MATVIGFIYGDWSVDINSNQLEVNLNNLPCFFRCPTYTNLPSQCYLVRAAGKCCPQAMCRNPDGTQVNPMNPGSKYPVYGTYPGGTTGFRPNYIPGQPITGSRSKCILVSI